MVKIGLKRAAVESPAPSHSVLNEGTSTLAATSFTQQPTATPVQFGGPSSDQTFAPPSFSFRKVDRPKNASRVSYDNTSSDSESTDDTTEATEEAVETESVSALPQIHINTAYVEPEESVLAKELSGTTLLSDVCSKEGSRQLPWDVSARPADFSGFPATLSQQCTSVGPLSIPAPEYSGALATQRKTQLDSRPDLAFGLSFRAVFSKQNNLLVPGFVSQRVVPDNAREGSIQGHPGTLIQQRIANDTTDVQPLSVLALHSTQETAYEGGRVAFCTSTAGLLDSKLLDELARCFASCKTPTFCDKVGSRSATNTVKLIEAMWGNDADDDSFAEGAEGVTLSAGYEDARRRRRLMQWLHSASDLEKLAQTSSVYDLALNGRAVDAAKQSRRGKNPTQAALLLAAQGSARVQQLLLSNTTEQVPDPVRQLLAPTDTPHRRWKQSLRRHLELAPRTETLKASLQSFLSTTQCTPAYHEALLAEQRTRPLSTEELRALKEGAGKQDICANLLQIWCGGCGEEDPTAALCDPMTARYTHTDYSLNWLVCLLLSGTDAVQIEVPGERLQMLTEAHAEQLIAAGQWRWATCILLSLSAPDTRKSRITKLLSQYTKDITPSNPTLGLPVDLRVPVKWIADASAAVTPAAINPPAHPTNRPPLGGLLDLDESLIFS